MILIQYKMSTIQSEHQFKSQNLVVRADITTNGRYANQFIRAMAAHFIAENLGAQPFYPPINLGKLGIQLYRPSTTNTIPTYSHCGTAQSDSAAQQTIDLAESNFMDYTRRPIPEPINSTHSPSIILDLNQIYCQTPEHAIKMKDFLHGELEQEGIKQANPHRERYEKNNDVFIHVRLGDVPFHNPGSAYYDKVLSSLNFTSGYISSDTINHPICMALIRKYKLQIINQHIQIEDLLQFGSTCKYIILSAGTFSWLIGVLGFNSQSQVYYPDPALKRRWHGDIFECMSEWQKINY